MTRTKAKQSIERGLAYVNGTQCFKPAAVIKDTDLAELKKLPEYASFGGEKLAKALQDFDFSVQDMTCADIGASNGGFTSCLLLNGAKKVFAIDVGECALPPHLQTDERVVVKDRTNARYITSQDLGQECDLAVIDVSFISLELILPAAGALVRKGGHIIALIKPQFEVGRSGLSKNGMVLSEKERRRAVEKVREAGRKAGLAEENFTTAPIREKKNVEYLILFAKK